MENKNGHSETYTLFPYWFWVDDNTLVSDVLGILVVTDAQWESLPDDTKLQFRPIDLGGGVISLGLIAGKFLLVRMS